MNTITLSMTRQAGRAALSNLLDTIYRTNRTFTISFVKHSGEPRIINGIAKNYKQQKGTGSVDVAKIGTIEEGCGVFT